MDNPQISSLSVAECQLDSVGLVNAEFGTRTTVRNTVLRVTSYKKDPDKRYGWTSEFNPANQEVIFHPKKIKDDAVIYPTAYKESYCAFDSINAYDRAGLSIGLFNDTVHSGNAQKILKRFKEIDLENFSKIFYWMDFKTVDGDLLIVYFDTENTIPLQHFRRLQCCEAVVEASYLPTMQMAMLERCYSWLADIRKKSCVPFNFFSAKSEAVILSLSVNLGGGGCRKYIHKVDQTLPTEEERLNQLIEFVLAENPGKKSRIDLALKVNWKDEEK